MKTKYPMFENGAKTLVRFDHDDTARMANTVLWVSAGGTPQSRDYKRMLTALLSRAGKAGLTLKRVAIETRTTKDLSLADRTVKLGKPVKLGSLDEDQADKLRARIGTGAASVGRPPGAKGGGNTTKAIRLYFDRGLTAGDLARLSGAK